MLIYLSLNYLFIIIFQGGKQINDFHIIFYVELSHLFGKFNVSL